MNQALKRFLIFKESFPIRNEWGRREIQTGGGGRRWSGEERPDHPVHPGRYMNFVSTKTARFLCHEDCPKVRMGFLHGSKRPVRPEVRL